MFKFDIVSLMQVDTLAVRAQQLKYLQLFLTKVIQKIKSNTINVMQTNFNDLKTKAEDQHVTLCKF